MLARGIRSYHRPTRLEDAMSLAAQGVRPLAGGTRLLAAPQEVPNVLDLSALELVGLRVDEEDLVLAYKPIVMSRNYLLKTIGWGGIWINIVK